MLSAAWLIAAVVLTILITWWAIFTLTRLDRLHARVDAAYATLDAQLVRRAAALLQVAQTGSGSLPQAGRYAEVATAALTAPVTDRQSAENEVGHAISELAAHAVDVGAAEAAELRESCARVTIARRFYNDAVRDTRGLRARWMPRILHLAGHRDLPLFFDIDDTSTFPAPGATPGKPGSTQETST